MVSRYQTPGAVRRAGRTRIEAYLKRQGVSNASKLAKEAFHAAEAQRAATPAEEVASEIVRELAERALSLKERTAELDGELECRLLAHPLAEVLLSLPGMGRVLGAEFLAAVGDPRDAFATSGHPAA